MPLYGGFFLPIRGKLCGHVRGIGFKEKLWGNFLGKSSQACFLIAAAQIAA